MSRVLSKLSPLMQKSRSVRSFSSSTSGPFVSLCSYMTPSPDGRNVGEALLWNLQNFKLVKSPEKTVPDELYDATLVGASHGWGLFSNRQDRSVVISDFLNPYASKKEANIIPLPPFTAMPSCQTEVLCNVAMSSSPEPYDKDWVVGIKFLGNQLSLCRPRRDLRWTNISTPFESWDTSKLMYSKKDERFYLLAPGGNYLCSWDLNFKKDRTPKFHELVLHGIPDMPYTHREMLDSSCREDHWVESDSGECFLVKWYTQYSPYQTTDWFKIPIPIVMVFREEETKDGRKHMRYTDDIGDLSIFISKSEDFCVTASSGRLHASSINLNGRLFATLNIKHRTVGCFEYPEGTPDRIPYSPYWLPPVSH